MSVTAEYFVGLEWSSSTTCPFQLDISFLDDSAWPLWREGEVACYPDFPVDTGRIGGIYFGRWEFGDGLGPGNDGNVGPGDLSFLWEVTDDTMEVSTQRGRDSNLDSWPMGVCTITLKDPTGKYNPVNTQSEFWPTVRPGRDAAVLMKYAGDWEGVFYGTVRDIEHRPADYVTVVTVVDAFYRLSRNQPRITAMVNATIGEVMHRICEECGLTNDNLRDFDDGPTLPAWSATGDKTGLALIKDLIDVYRGWFFVDRNGVIRWVDVMGTLPDMGSPDYVPTENPESLSIGDLLATKAIEYSPSVSLDNLRNKVIVTADVPGTGQVEQSAVDQASIDIYGELTASYSVEGSLVTSPTQMQELAEYLLGLWGGLNPPVRNLRFIGNEGHDLMSATEVVDVGSIVQVLDENGDLQEFVIQSIDHRIGTANLVHEVNTTLVRATGEDNTALVSQGARRRRR